MTEASPAGRPARRAARRFEQPRGHAMHGIAAAAAFGAVAALAASFAASSLSTAQDRPQELDGKAAFTDWHADRPGLVRHIRPADLPPPNMASPPENGVRIVRRGNEKPAVPPGFEVSLFAEGLEEPRIIREAPNGDVFVAESVAGRIRVLRARRGRQSRTAKSSPPGCRAVRHRVLSAGQRSGMGLCRQHQCGGPFRLSQWRPQGARRAADPWCRGFRRETATGRATSPSPRTGRECSSSVGSASNAAEGHGKLDAAALAAWTSQHPLGAAWGAETNRADVLVFDPDGSNGRIYATGIRNCSGLAVAANGEVWCSTNERDSLGDNVPPDYITRVKEGAFYGWPWYYIGANEDPRHRGERPDLKDRITIPDVLMEAHSASLGLAVYDGRAVSAGLSQQPVCRRTWLVEPQQAYRLQGGPGDRQGRRADRRL